MARCQYHRRMSEPSPSKPSRDADKFIVRLPDGMRDRIAEVAKANNRTMNAEVVARLQSTFEQTATGMSTEALLLELAQRIGPTLSLAIVDSEFQKMDLESVGGDKSPSDD